MKQKTFLILSVLILLLSTINTAQADPSITAGSPPPIGWVFERVDAPRYYSMLTPSMFQYSHGTAYIAFGGDHLYYAYESGISWNREIIDPSMGVGGSASLALRSTDNGAMISYYDATNRTLKFARQVFSSPGVYTWQLSMLDTGADGCTAIDLDSNNYPAIAYQKNENLYFKRYSCNGISCAWGIGQRVDTALKTGEECDLSFDSNDRPHIAYSDESKDDLKYAFHNGTTWTSLTVDENYESGLSLALDSSNYPHIAYSGNGYSLYYAFLDRGTWEITQVDDANTMFTSISLFENRANSPHIAYNSLDGPKYAHLDEMNANCTADGWACDVTNPSDFAVYMSLHMIDSGAGAAARLVYLDLNSSDLEYADDTDGSLWMSRSVGMPFASYGKGISLAFANYDPVISYVDSTNGALRFAQRAAEKGGPTCGIDSTGWDCRNVGFDSAIHTSLAVDYYYDLPSILFEYRTTPGLRLTRFNGSAWETPVAITNSNIEFLDQKLVCSFKEAQYTCNTHAAYYDADTDSVMYAHTVDFTGNCGGGDWQCETVDGSLGATVAGVDLELDTGSKPAVSYYNSTTDQIKVAYRVGDMTGTGCSTGNGDWECDIVETVGFISSPVTALDFTESNTAVVAYFDGDEETVKYAYTTTPRGTFTSQMIYSVSGSRDLDLVIREGLLAIAFYDNDQEDLVLARLVYDNQGNCGISGNFRCEIIDSAGNVGHDLDMALSPDNRIYIAYSDSTNGDLKLAWQAQTIFLPLITK